MARTQYLPDDRRRGIALCLSGGGFRATLFHLGAMRRLNELGILSKFNTFTSVSGGSIASGVLATRWAELSKSLAGGVFDSQVFDRAIAEPIRAFCRKDLRTDVLLWAANPLHWAMLLRSDYSVTDRLVKSYGEELSLDLPLQSTPDQPRFIFCASTLDTGANWEFNSGSRGKMGDYLLGMVPTDKITVAQAVGASSAFPVTFPPLLLRFRDAAIFTGPLARERPKMVEWIALTDGGVYDNMGLEPVWKSHATLLVSDAGQPFQREDDPKVSIDGRLARCYGITANQSAALRRRWLIGNFLSGAMAGTYWGIGTKYQDYELADVRGYQDQVLEQIKRIRTDLDEFSEGEVGVLENHGYVLTDAAVRKWQPRLIDAATPPKPQWPHPQFAPGQSAAEAAIKDSHNRGVLADIWKALIGRSDER